MAESTCPACRKPLPCSCEVVFASDPAMGHSPATVSCRSCGITFTLKSVEPGIVYRCARCHSQVQVGEPAAAVEKPVQTLGKYEMGELLGKGGMGAVRRAYDKELGRAVAIKFMTGVSEEEDLKRFRREAQVMAKLQHPNIVQVYEVGEHEDRPYIVMQLIDGKPLTRVRFQDVPQMLRKFEAICRAVDYAHSQGIIHRDIKPDNMMLDARGQVFIMDFGLARRQDARGSMSKTGTAIGTPAYMAPEQAAGRVSEVDRSSDVYSLGASLYWLTTHRVPFGGTDALQILMKVVTQEVTPPRMVNPKIPPEVETIVLKAMSKEKERRYRSAKELADDVRRYLGGEPIQARPPSFTYRFRKKIAKHPWVLAIPGVVLLAVGFAVSMGLQRSSQGRDFLQEADRAYAAGDFARAQEHYDKAAALGVSDAGSKMRRADCVARTRALEEEARAKRELELLQPVLDRARRHLEAARAMRLQAVWQHDRFLEELRRSRESCDAVLAKMPRSALALSIRGRAWIEEGEFDRGLSDLEAAGANLEHGKATLEVFLYRRWSGVDPGAATLERAGQLLGRREPAEIFAAAGLSKGLFQAFERYYPGAADELRVEAEKSPHDRLVCLAQARTLLELGLFADGSAMSSRLVAADPKNPEAHLLRGILRCQAREDDQGEPDLSRAIELDGRSASAYRWRGIARRRLKKLNEARRDLDRAIELGPKDADTWADRAALKFEGGDAGGDGDWAEAVRLDPGIEGRRGEEIQEARELALGGGDAHRWYQRGSEQWKRRQAREALDSLTKAIELDSEHADAHFLRGIVLESMKEQARALADYDRAIRLRPDFPEAYVNRSALRYLMRDYEGCIEDCARLLRFDPNSFGAYNNRGNAYSNLGLYAKAIDDFNSALRIRPDAADVLANRGKAKGQLGDLAGSLADLNRSLDLDPLNAMTYLDRGVTYGQLGREEEAFRDFNRAIELEPNYAMAYRNRAVSFLKMKRYAEAIRDAEKAMALNPALSDAMKRLIQEIRNQGD
jgi:tetratricopeptide (TPR) repeat protein